MLCDGEWTCQFLQGNMGLAFIWSLETPYLGAIDNNGRPALVQLTRGVVVDIGDAGVLFHHLIWRNLWFSGLVQFWALPASWSHIFLYSTWFQGFHLNLSSGPRNIAGFASFCISNPCFFKGSEVCQVFHCLPPAGASVGLCGHQGCLPTHAYIHTSSMLSAACMSLHHYLFVTCP